MRKSGILMPVFSLPSPYGIGGFNKEAERFIDFLSRSGQSCWQILPLGPTSFGDSPYQSPSAFAGNPYFIDIDALCDEGMLTKEECDIYASQCPDDKIDYGFLYNTRYQILGKAYTRFTPDPSFYDFCEKEKYWLQPYAEFAALKSYFGGAGMDSWSEDVRLDKRKATEPVLDEISGEVEYQKFLQYRFSKDWHRIKTYANEKGIKIIGDMPLYPAMDSADVWSNPELFEMDENRRPTRLSGCPPDSFSPKGQLWGNPLYRWEAHKASGFKWWINRMRRNMELYDVVRIDHFRGLESYWAIEAGRDDAISGVWEKAPGRELFDALYKYVPDLHLIAEDLGFITEDVRKLLDYAKCPGMKILQFAFDSREESDFLPHNFTENAVVYTGSHDNPTILSWVQDALPQDIAYAIKYMHVYENNIEIAKGLIRLAMASVAKTCIIPLADWLLLGDEGRVNTPGTVGGNWQLRILEYPDPDKIAELTKLYGRKADKYV